mgnify:FL=1
MARHRTKLTHTHTNIITAGPCYKTEPYLNMYIGAPWPNGIMQYLLLSFHNTQFSSNGIHYTCTCM